MGIWPGYECKIVYILRLGESLWHSNQRTSKGSQCDSYRCVSTRVTCTYCTRVLTHRMYMISSTYKLVSSKIVQFPQFQQIIWVQSGVTFDISLHSRRLTRYHIAVSLDSPQPSRQVGEDEEFLNCDQSHEPIPNRDCDLLDPCKWIVSVIQEGPVHHGSSASIWISPRRLSVGKYECATSPPIPSNGYESSWYRE